MRSICVFCGSRAGLNPFHTELAKAAGQAIAQRGWRMVYGGAKSGLMGIAARAALDAGGPVLGVIPEFLIPVEGCESRAQIRITATLAARKAMMVEEADGFLILPGGPGTVEEIFDMIMLRQLGRHAKPAAFVDAQFWAPLQTLLIQIRDTGYADPEIVQSLQFFATIDAALADLDARASEAAA